MAKKTTGRIYTTGVNKVYYLRYASQGKDHRVRLLDTSGAPICGTGPNGETLSRSEATEARNAAEAAASRHLAHLRENDRVERLRLLQNDLRDAESAAIEAEADLLNTAATIEAGWDLFMTCSKRPASCRRYKAGDNIPRNSTPGNYRAYYSRFKAWLKHHRKVRLLSEITPDMASAFMDHIDDISSANTHGKYLFFLKNFFSTLAGAGKIIIKENPFADIDAKEGEVHSKRPLSREQIANLLDNATGEMKILIAAGYFIGLRLGDCATLKWCEVDLNRQIIERQPRKTKTTAKNKDKALVKVGVPPYLATLLAELPQVGEYVLPDTARRYLEGHQRAISGEIQNFFEHCGIVTRAEGTGSRYSLKGKLKIYEKRPRAITYYGHHSLRHAFVSHNAAAGVPLAIVQRAVGHGSPVMTETYLHIDDGAARRYAAHLDLPSAPSARDMVIDVPAQTGAKVALHNIIDTLDDDTAATLLATLKEEGKA